jgi:2-oxoglutarate dehydrogenase E1 component
MSPKSLLRHKDAASPVSAFTEGRFEPLIAETSAAIAPEGVQRVILCSGKVYFDLVRRRAQRRDVAILRVEELYPFPGKALEAELQRYPAATEVVWCQDEPQNQGAWYFVQHLIRERMRPGQKLGYVGRVASAAPAVGYTDLHVQQQTTLLDQAFGRLKGTLLSR